MANMSERITKAENSQAPNRRDILLGSTALAASTAAVLSATTDITQAQPRGQRHPAVGLTSSIS
jgi:hypothetical protein